jgi:hypothetical protein
MMSKRVQVILSEKEREVLRIQARRDGQSLSAWLRTAALEKLGDRAEEKAIDSLEALRGFFKECDARELGREPDWEEHRDVIGRSRAAGCAPT